VLQVINNDALISGQNLKWTSTHFRHIFVDGRAPECAGWPDWMHSGSSLTVKVGCYSSLVRRVERK